MEIERKNSKRLCFKDLKVGDVFLDEDDCVMMVVDEDYGLGDKDYADGYAINLASGYHYGYSSEDDVVKVSAKLIVD